MESSTNQQGNLVPANLGAKPEVVETKTEPTIPSADKALEAIKARVRAANPHLDDPNLPHQLKKPIAQQAPKAEVVETDIKPSDKAVLSELAKAQASYREAQAKLKEREAKVPDSEYGAKVKKLWAGTDQEKLQLLGELSGKDPTEALADLVEIFYNQPGTAPAGDKPTIGAAPASPEAKQLMELVKDLSEQVKALKEAPAKVSQEQLVQGTRSFLKAQVTKLGLEISSRAENIEETVDKALALAATVVQELKLDPAALTQEQAEQVAAESIKRAEAQFEQLGKRFSKVQAAPKPSLYDKPIPRAAPRIQVDPGESKPVPFGKGWNDYVERARNAWSASKT